MPTDPDPPSGSRAGDPPPPPPPPPGAAAGGDLTMAHVVYALYAASVLNGLTALIGVIIAHVKRGDPDPLADNHYAWQIRSFWYGLALTVAAAVATVVLVVVPVIGWLAIPLVWLALVVWYVWRVVKGWVRLGDRRPLDDPEALW